MNYIEMDHTSSGVQIAAAMARDSEAAQAVNLMSSKKKADIYKSVALKANAAFKALGLDLTLNRSDVKKSVIARVYGGGHKTAYHGLAEATGLNPSEHPAAFKAFNEAVKEVMAGVVKVQAYFTYLAKAVQAAGNSSFALTLPSGVVYEVSFSEKEIEVNSLVLNDSDDVTRVDGLAYPSEKMDVGTAARQMVAGYVQGLDSHLLAQVQAALAEAGIPFMCKHDAYLIPDVHAPFLHDAVKKAFYETFSADLLADVLAEVVCVYGLDVAPFSDYGTFSVSDVLNADFILA